MAGKPGQRSTKALVPPKEYRKSRIDQLDGRYRAVKALKSRQQQLAADLGGDLSYQKQSLTCRVVCLESWIEQQEQKLIAGQPINETLWLSALNCFTGLIGRLGIERQARPIKSLAQYLQDQTKESDHGT
jgi:hypothetical protein